MRLQLAMGLRRRFALVVARVRLVLQLGNRGVPLFELPRQLVKLRFPGGDLPRERSPIHQPDLRPQML